MLRRLKKQVSRVFWPGSDSKELSDHNSASTRHGCEKVPELSTFGGVDSRTGTCNDNISLVDLRHHTLVETTERTPLHRHGLVTNKERLGLKPGYLSATALSATPRGYYHAFSDPSLAGFDPVPETEHDDVHPPDTGTFSAQSPTISDQTQGQERETFRYRHYRSSNPAVLNDLVTQSPGATAASATITSIEQTPRSATTNAREYSLQCIICTDTKPVTDFPFFTITSNCTHTPTTCLECVAASIRSDLNSRLWSEIRCPECREPLQYDDVQRYADPETRERYQTLSFRSALSGVDNFVWCSSGCGSGQVHDGGVDSPIVICIMCNRRTCFAHRVAWHENLACDEYDALQADPTNFRSRFELENEAAEEEGRRRREQEDADRVYAQSLAEDEQLRAEDVARQEKVAREAKEKEERLREERRRAQEAMRAVVARKKREEEKSNRTLARTTKPCPGCGWAIEKNLGW